MKGVGKPQENLGGDVVDLGRKWQNKVYNLPFLLKHKSKMYFLSLQILVG